MKLKRSLITALVYVVIIGCFLAGTYAASFATTTVAQMIPMERDHTIVIDAGHGGVDGGATSCSGVLESRFNLEICLKLNDLFHLLGYKTLMVRTTDVSVYTSGETIAAKKISDLRQRVGVVNKADNPLLLSIHQNYFSDNRYSGAQVFYGGEELSRELAESLQGAFKNTLNPDSNRSAKKAEGIYLMEHVDATAVLIECGFLSNPEEEAKLRSGDYQRKLCCVIAATVGQFLTK